MHSWNDHLVNNNINNSWQSIVVRGAKLNLDADPIYPEMNLFRCSLEELVDKVKNKIPKDDWKYLVGWKKVVKNPYNAQTFLNDWAEATFLGRHTMKSLNIGGALIDNNIPVITYKGIRVELMFLGNGCTNKNLQNIGAIVNTAIGQKGWRIKTLCGDDIINSKRVTGGTVQDQVITEIESCADVKENLLLIANNLPTRSFSISLLQNLHLCFDGAGRSIQIQKIARVLSMHSNKVSNIFDHRFDPNVAGNIDSWSLEAADNLAERNGTNIKKELGAVLGVFNIFDMLDDGCVRLETAEYIRKLFSMGIVFKVIGNQIMMNKYNDIDIDLRIKMAEAVGKLSKEKIKTILAGKTREKSKSNAKKSETSDYDTELLLRQLVRQCIEEICETLPWLMNGTKKNKLSEALNEAGKEQYKKILEKRLPVELDVISKLNDLGVINEKVFELAN